MTFVIKSHISVCKLYIFGTNTPSQQLASVWLAQLMLLLAEHGSSYQFCGKDAKCYCRLISASFFYTVCTPCKFEHLTPAVSHLFLYAVDMSGQAAAAYSSNCFQTGINYWPERSPPVTSVFTTLWANTSPLPGSQVNSNNTCKNRSLTTAVVPRCHLVAQVLFQICFLSRILARCTDVKSTLEASIILMNLQFGTNFSQSTLFS